MEEINTHSPAGYAGSASETAGSAAEVLGADAGSRRSVRNRRNYNFRADMLKFWLMPFVCFASFGFPTRLGNVISILSGFAPLCFYLLCGYFILSEDVKQTERSLLKEIRRSGLFFALMTLLCLAVNLCYCLFIGVEMGEIPALLLRRRVLFNFIVLSAWPFHMGENVWFIQNLFYGCIGLFVLSKLGLLQKKAVRLGLLAVCGLLLFFTGEGAAIVRFRLLGYSYLTPTVVTFALPYLLLGGMLRGQEERLRKLGSGRLWALAAVGLVMAAGEFELISRLGLLATTYHAIGLGLTAFALCAQVIAFPNLRSERPTAPAAAPMEQTNLKHRTKGEKHRGGHRKPMPIPLLPVRPLEPMTYVSDRDDMRAPGPLSFLLVGLHLRHGLAADCGRVFARRIYALSQPVAFLLLVPLSHYNVMMAILVQRLGGVLVYAMCFVLALVIELAMCSMMTAGGDTDGIRLPVFLRKDPYSPKKRRKKQQRSAKAKVR